MFFHLKITHSNFLKVDFRTKVNNSHFLSMFLITFDVIRNERYWWRNDHNERDQFCCNIKTETNVWMNLYFGRRYWWWWWWWSCCWWLTIMSSRDKNTCSCKWGILNIVLPRKQICWLVLIQKDIEPKSSDIINKIKNSLIKKTNFYK